MPQGSGSSILGLVERWLVDQLSVLSVVLIAFFVIIFNE